MAQDSIIHKRIETLFDELLHLQKTLTILGFPEYWPSGAPKGATQHQYHHDVDPSASAGVRKSLAAGSKALREVVIDEFVKQGRVMGVDDLHDILMGTALAHESDERIRRRKLSQAIYANKEKLIALPGGGGRQGLTYGLREWFVGDTIKPEYKKK